jgi:tetratricopeptide (TPR) repeat protein
MILTLKQRILNKLENNKKELSEKIAEIAGYSGKNKINNFKKVLINQEREFDNFNGLVKVVQTLFPREEKKLMAEYALTVDPNKKTARYMLEYLSLNKKTEELHKLIEKMLNCSNKESVLWASLFSIDRQVINKNLTTTEALTKFSGLALKSIDTIIRCEIMKSYSFLDMKDYQMAYEFVYPLQEKILDIKEDYIRETFLGRCLSILAECEIRRDNIKSARDYCQEILRNTQVVDFKIKAYLHFGNSFILESYDKALGYLYKGLELANSYDENMTLQLKRSINTTNNYWKKVIPYPNLTEDQAPDLHENAFSEINKNNLNKAKEILESINQESMNDNEKGFHFYLKGLISKSIDDFSLSVIHFKKSKDSHFVKLPLLELQKLGLNKTLLRALFI